MDAGQLRHRVTLQDRQDVQDALGGVNRDPIWNDVADLWAAVEPLRGREYFDGQQANGELTHRVTMRYQYDVSVKPEMRLKFNDRVLEIASVINRAERNNWLEVICHEV